MPFINGTEVIIPAPPGYEVNFANPPQSGKVEIFAVAIVENVLAFMFLCQRLYTKIFLMKQFQIEDGKTFESPPRRPLVVELRPLV
jgi:hypothetical protein